MPQRQLREITNDDLVRLGRAKDTLVRYRRCLPDNTGDVFTMMGTQGTKYKVTISQNPSCTCRDWAHRPCKHLINVFLYYLHIPPDDPVWYQTELLHSEVEKVLGRKINVPTPLEPPTTRERLDDLDTAILDESFLKDLNAAEIKRLLLFAACKSKEVRKEIEAAHKALGGRVRVFTAQVAEAEQILHSVKASQRHEHSSEVELQGVETIVDGIIDAFNERSSFQADHNAISALLDIMRALIHLDSRNRYEPYAMRIGGAIKTIFGQADISRCGDLVQKFYDIAEEWCSQGGCNLLVLARGLRTRFEAEKCS